jgi:folate-dependent phosphoribosylglycinamide formyltransferase PurN
MKTILLCNAAPNQRALAHRLNEVSALRGIAVVEIPPSKKRKITTRAASFTVGRPFRRAWFDLLSRYESNFPTFPDVPTTSHQGVNSDSVRDMIQQERPDLVLVSGTDLLRQPLIDEVRRSGNIMNLHTGISPYIKGGPNCTNWALALGEFDLIGNTVMWIDAGIDSGNIVATERTPLTGDESLGELHLKVMEHGHDLFRRCYQLWCRGVQLPSVPQREIDGGRLFLTRDWSGFRMACAWWNFVVAYRAERVAQMTSTVYLVAPDHGQRR